jgi:hypothetical protein
MRFRISSVPGVFSVMNMPLLVRTCDSMPWPVAVSTTVEASSCGRPRSTSKSHSADVSRLCSRKMRGFHESACRTRVAGVPGRGSDAAATPLNSEAPCGRASTPTSDKRMLACNCRSSSPSSSIQEPGPACPGTPGSASLMSTADERPATRGSGLARWVRRRGVPPSMLCTAISAEPPAKTQPRGRSGSGDRGSCAAPASGYVRTDDDAKDKQRGGKHHGVGAPEAVGRRRRTVRTHGARGASACVPRRLQTPLCTAVSGARVQPASGYTAVRAAREGYVTEPSSSRIRFIQR